MTNFDNSLRLMSLAGKNNEIDNKLVTILLDISDKIDKLSKEHEDTREMIQDHVRGEVHLMSVIETAFPEGDLRGHKLDHERRISESALRKEFWQKMMFELVKWGLLGFIGWLILQTWTGILKGPR